VKTSFCLCQQRHTHVPLSGFSVTHLKAFWLFRRRPRGTVRNRKPEGRRVECLDRRDIMRMPNQGAAPKRRASFVQRSALVWRGLGRGPWLRSSVGDWGDHRALRSSLSPIQRLVAGSAAGELPRVQWVASDVGAKGRVQAGPCTWCPHARVCSGTNDPRPHPPSAARRPNTVGAASKPPPRQTPRPLAPARIRNSSTNLFMHIAEEIGRGFLKGHRKSVTQSRGLDYSLCAFLMRGQAVLVANGASHGPCTGRARWRQASGRSSKGAVMVPWHSLAGGNSRTHGRHSTCRTWNRRHASVFLGNTTPKNPIFCFFCPNFGRGRTHHGDTAERTPGFMAPPSANTHCEEGSVLLLIRMLSSRQFAGKKKKNTR